MENLTSLIERVRAGKREAYGDQSNMVGLLARPDFHKLPDAKRLGELHATPDDPAIYLDFAVTAASLDCRLSLCYPATVLRSLLPHLRDMKKRPRRIEHRRGFNYWHDARWLPLSVQRQSPALPPPMPIHVPGRATAALPSAGQSRQVPGIGRRHRSRRARRPTFWRTKSSRRHRPFPHPRPHDIAVGRGYGKSRCKFGTSSSRSHQQGDAGPCSFNYCAQTEHGSRRGRDSRHW